MSLDQPNDPSGRDLQRPLDPIARNEKDLPNRGDGKTKISRVVDVLMSDAPTKDAIQPAQVSRRSEGPSTAMGPLAMPEQPWATAAGPRPASSPMEMLSSVLRYKWTLILIAILVSAPVIALVWTQTIPEYRARAEVRVRPIIPRLVFNTEDNGMIPLYDSFVNTQVSLMRSPTVLQRVLDQQAVQQTQWYRNTPETLLQRLNSNQIPPMERLRDSLSVRPRPRTEIIDVSFNDPSSGEAKIIVDAVLAQYIMYTGLRSDATRDEIYRKLVEQQQTLAREISGQEMGIAALRKSLGTGAPEELVASKRVHLDQLQVQLSALQQNIAIVEWDLEQTASPDGNDASADGAAEADAYRQRVYHEDGEWRRLDINLRTIEHQIANSIYGPKNPNMTKLQSDLEFAGKLLKQREAQLDELWENQADRIVANPLPTGNTEDLQGEQVREILMYRLSRAKQEEQLLREELEKQRKEFELVFADAQMLAKENLDLERKRELLEAVQMRIDQKDMERNVAGSIEVLTPAFSSSKPESDRRVVYTAMALFVGLGLGSGTAFLRASRNQTIHAPKDIPQPVRVPFLGHVPLVNNTRPPGKLLADELEQNQFLLVESIRVLRTALLTRLAGRTGATVLVTSASEGTGKSSFTMVLGRSLAQAGKKVLLIDTDFHKVTLSKRFELTSRPGFMETLRDKSLAKLPVYPTKTPGLDIMPAGIGNGDETTVEEIANGAFKSCIQRVRKQYHYDVILLDASPILPVADATILAGQVDGTILVEREQVSQRAHVVSAMSRLQSAGGTMLGTVFVGAMDSRSYGYGYGYGSYGRKRQT